MLGFTTKLWGRHLMRSQKTCMHRRVRIQNDLLIKENRQTWHGMEIHVVLKEKNKKKKPKKHSRQNMAQSILGKT